MTEQTQRALERLPDSGKYITQVADGACYIRDAEKLYIEGRIPSVALGELAARSPRLVEMLDRLLTAADYISHEQECEFERIKEAAETLLRETTRAMLSE